MKTLVLGIGNPILTDDAVGIRIARHLKSKADNNIEVAETCEGGLSLLEAIDNHGKLIVVDSIKTGKGKPGHLYRFTLDELSSSSGFVTSHGIGIAAACNLLLKTGNSIPRIIVIYAVEISDNTTFSEKCTTEIEEQIPEIARQIIEKEQL